nr:hypothetical protein CFP56_12226 [Quercus suber]
MTAATVSSTFVPPADTGFAPISSPSSAVLDEPLSAPTSTTAVVPPTSSASISRTTDPLSFLLTRPSTIAATQSSISITTDSFVPSQPYPSIATRFDCVMWMLDRATRNAMGNDNNSGCHMRVSINYVPPEIWLYKMPVFE